MPTHDPHGVYPQGSGPKAAGRASTPAARGVRSDGAARSHREHAAERAITRFLHSFRLLTRSVRLYQPDHPRIEETLVTAERELRAAQQWVSPLEFTVEPGPGAGGRISAVCAAEARSAKPLHDARGELAALAG
ncbi:MAG TPA: hypothetical protein VGA40_09930, partial [Candidatus Acidoferrales bacterium]